MWQVVSSLHHVLLAIPFIWVPDKPPIHLNTVMNKLGAGEQPWEKKVSAQSNLIPLSIKARQAFMHHRVFTAFYSHSSEYIWSEGWLKLQIITLLVSAHMFKKNFYKSLKCLETQCLSRCCQVNSHTKLPSGKDHNDISNSNYTERLKQTLTLYNCDSVTALSNCVTLYVPLRGIWLGVSLQVESLDSVFKFLSHVSRLFN